MRFANLFIPAGGKGLPLPGLKVMKPSSAKVMILTTCILLTACGTDASQSIDPNAIRTEAVSTFSSSLTKAFAPTITTPPSVTSLPTFTPAASEEPRATAGPENSCYNLIWIEDRTIPDGTQMKASQEFSKTWLVQNNGGCAWAPGFTFSHVGGDSMQGRTIVLKEPIPVGAKREISLELVVPAGVNGLVQSSWRMADSSGTFFGDTLSVNIVVGDSGTPAATGLP